MNSSRESMFVEREKTDKHAREEWETKQKRKHSKKTLLKQCNHKRRNANKMVKRQTKMVKTNTKNGKDKQKNKNG